MIKIDRAQENRGPDDLENNGEKLFGKMPFFKCSCGIDIIVPDLYAMEKAIENHLIEHKKLTGQRLTEEILTQEILKVISGV